MAWLRGAGGNPPLAQAPQLAQPSAHSDLAVLLAQLAGGSAAAHSAVPTAKLAQAASAFQPFQHATRMSSGGAGGAAEALQALEFWAQVSCYAPLTCLGSGLQASPALRMVQGEREIRGLTDGPNPPQLPAHRQLCAGGAALSAGRAEPQQASGCSTARSPQSMNPPHGPLLPFAALPNSSRRPEERAAAGAGGVPGAGPCAAHGQPRSHRRAAAIASRSGARRTAGAAFWTQRDVSCARHRHNGSGRSCCSGHAGSGHAGGGTAAPIAGAPAAQPPAGRGWPVWLLRQRRWQRPAGPRLLRWCSCWAGLARRIRSVRRLTGTSAQACPTRRRRQRWRQRQGVLLGGPARWAAVPLPHQWQQWIAGSAPCSAFR